MSIQGGPVQKNRYSVEKRQLYHDKARMYEERLHLQEQVNILTTKNRCLLTQLRTAERESSKFEKLFIQSTIPKRKLKKPRR